MRMYVVQAPGRAVCTMGDQKNEDICYDMPEDACSIGAVQDGDKAFLFGFKTRREVFVQPGFVAIPNDDQNLNACARAICDMLRMQAILKAMTITQETLLAQLCEEERAMPEAERNAAVVLTAVRQAVTNYANSRDQ